MATQVTRSIGALNLGVTGATNASPIVITTATSHLLTTGQLVLVSSVGGNTAANGTWRITVTSATQFRLDGSTGSGAYTGGTGAVTRNYTTVGAWLAATAGNLVSANEQRTGELYDDADFTLASAKATITNATFATPIVITTAAAHGYATGDTVRIQDMAGAHAAEDDWAITVVSPTTFSLDGSVGTSGYLGGGRVERIWRMNGSTTDSTRYRELVAWSGHRYHPETSNGVRLIKTGGGTALVIEEDYARLKGFALEVWDGLNDDIEYCLEARGGLLVVDAIVGKYTEGAGSGSAAAAHEVFGHTAGGVAGISRFTNCVAIGNGNKNAGAKYGFRSAIANDVFANCVAHNLQRSSAVGFSITGSSTSIVVSNCIATDCKTCFVFTSTGSGASFASNISSDATATTVSGAVGCYSSKTAEELFINPDIDDFRNRYTSPAVDHGVDFSAAIAADIVGTTRDVPFDIGVYESYFILPGVAPTEIISSVGSGAGRDYATLDAWKAATTKNLVAANERHIAELYADSTFAQGSTEFVLEGAVADATHYRHIRAATDNRYDIGTGGGALITGSGQSVIRLAEDYARLEGVGVDQQSSSSATERAAVRCTANRTRVDGVLAQILTGNFGGAWACFKGDTGVLQRFINCIAKGAGGSTGATSGYYVLSDESLVANCIAHAINQSPQASNGFVDGGSTAAFKNCIATDCYSSGFAAIASADRNEFNCSSDSSATGEGSLINKSAGSVFNDHTLGDFRLKFNSPCLGAGKALADEFTTDFAGAPRYLPWEIGSYEGAAAAPLLAPVELGKSHRLATLWDLIRLDGVAQHWTDHSHPLVVDGQSFVPEGALQASARRSELALKESNLEAAGPITADAMTFADMFAGRYRGARVRERVIDWRYPFAAPLVDERYEVGETKFNGERWTCELLGMTHRLQEPIGEVETRTCGWTLGQNFDKPADVPGCRVDLTAITEKGVEVTAVVDSRRTFECSALSGSFADDDFNFGYLTWKTGPNVGLRVEVKDYVQATREFTLRLELPYPVTVGDTFDVHTGCDRTYDTCQVKYGNTLNYRGNKFSPGTHKAMQSPVS